MNLLLETIWATSWLYIIGMLATPVIIGPLKMRFVGPEELMDIMMRWPIYLWEHCSEENE